MGDDARLLPTQMRMKSTQSALAFFTFLSCAILCVANTEKTIFLGPANINFPNVSPSLSELELYYLTPNHSSLRLELPRSFPNSTHPRGLQSWYILDNLLAGQRYEVRVCWLATEPTEFWLDTYTINQVFASPSLISLVSSFSESQIDRIKPTPNTQVPLSFVGNRSILLLHIQAAADYFTTNVTLMKEPPAVLADISKFVR